MQRLPCIKTPSELVIVKDKFFLSALNLRFIKKHDIDNIIEFIDNTKTTQNQLECDFLLVEDHGKISDVREELEYAQGYAKFEIAKKILEQIFEYFGKKDRMIDFNNSENISLDWDFYIVFVSKQNYS
ncbi:MAG: hypothetical protein GY830_07010 [Bacteroidetes bacterium]|nr:hypothetical protein [Bacteroidota bacterium]